MKKSILALGAAALFGGLGFAGSAQAIAFFGDSGNDNHDYAGGLGSYAQAQGLQLNPGGIGHELFVPYYSAQGSMSTMFNITNTDVVNGKVVKVRFRGAANSDDVRDFTVMLSPGDVWSASIARGADGVATLNTDDNSCTLPANVNAPFDALRLDPSLTADAQALHMNEGYIEVLNMADIPPRLWHEDDPVTPTNGGTPVYTNVTNPLFATTKHKSGVPACDQTILNSTDGILSEARIGSRQDAFDAGLGGPTGQLMVSYAVLTLDQVATYGGSATAIRAVTAGGAPARGNIIYSPQLQDDFGGIAYNNVNHLTGDPLLRTDVPASPPALNPLWYDLPDMSTPLAINDQPVYAAFGGSGLVTDAAAPLIQVDGELANALAKGSVTNDWIQSPADQWETDWVVSQPTRRYYAAVDYSDGKITWNKQMGANAGLTQVAPAIVDNRYGLLKSSKVSAGSLNLGTYACMQLTWSGWDREEDNNMVAGGTSMSPGAVVLNLNCGEVYTITFGHAGSAVLQAMVTNQWIDSTKLGKAGWGVVSLGGSLPVVGFSATSARYNGGNIGYTIPHRW